MSVVSLAELEAYAGVISALRAQGDLTKDKKELLGELTKILGYLFSLYFQFQTSYTKSLSLIMWHVVHIFLSIVYPQYFNRAPPCRGPQSCQWWAPHNHCLSVSVGFTWHFEMQNIWTDNCPLYDKICILSILCFPYPLLGLTLALVLVYLWC